MAKPDRELVFQLLERDLIEWAEDTSLRLVWADLLQMHDDRLGELIMLDHAARTAPKSERARLREAAEALRQELAPRLWTNQAARTAIDDPGVCLHWELGFVRELEIHTRKLQLRRGRVRYGRRGLTIADTVTWLVCTLLREPALRFVESLRIDIADTNAYDGSQWVRVGGLGAACLREVHVGHPARTRARPSGQWEPKGDGPNASNAPTSEQLASNFRRLRRFSYGGEMLRIHCRSGASQTREHHVKRLPGRPLTSPNRAALARALWDESTIVHQAAFAAARELGSRASFLLDELIWFLRPPLSRKDPRPGLALDVFVAIGPASAALLPEVLEHAEALLDRNDARREALLRWFTMLGPRAKAGLPIVERTLNRERRNREPKTLRPTARKARKAIKRG